MGLAPRINVEFGKTSLVVYDTTCKYDACANTTGHGAPNESISSAISATVEIAIPGITTPVIIDVYPYLPNSNGVGFEIDYVDLNINSIPPGEWNVKYTINYPGNISYTKGCWFLNTCPIDCCLAERVKKIDVKCGGEYDAETFRLISLLNGAIQNHCSCDYEKAHKLALYVYNRCECGC